MNKKDGRKLMAGVFLRTASTKSLKIVLKSNESNESYFKEALLEFLQDKTVDQNLRLIITALLIERGAC